MSDVTSTAYEWNAAIEPPSLLPVENNAINHTKNPCELRPADELETGNAFDMNVSCRMTPSSDSTGHRYIVSVEIQSADVRRHSGSFSAAFLFDYYQSDSVSLFADLVVIATSNVGNGDPSRNSVEEGIKLRMRTCGDGASGIWSFSDTAVRELRLRQSVPDCVYCVAERPLITGSSADYRPVSPAEVRIVRADGLILGSEESHSFYWYREPGGRAETAALVVRSPTDEYNGEYICVASAFAPLAGSAASSSSGSSSSSSGNRITKDDNRNKRTNTDFRSSAAAVPHKTGSRPEIRFRLNVQ